MGHGIWWFVYSFFHLVTQQIYLKACMHQVLLRWCEYSSNQNIPRERKKKKWKGKCWRGKKKSQRKFLPSGALQFIDGKRQ